MTERDADEMFQQLPWPFTDNRFPHGLGAVVQRTVLSGQSPARLVIHDSDNNWLVGDGRTDPNQPNACVATHIAHAVALNSSLKDLADLAPGWMAERPGPGQPWERSPHHYLPDQG
ncbi:hypothetical protein [Kineosporia sp. A_224]|uniref:hypothetical protein n=1 Tax=Kineosporia sp. A_224 TaxID=1962180 RepID=UPI00117B111E|nr:hypothetical protein [Kineosporia sp. A_224]